MLGVEGFQVGKLQVHTGKPLNLQLVNLQPQLSGGSGIRTHVGVTQTCFQDMRLQPLGHPSRESHFQGGGDFTIRPC